MSTVSGLRRASAVAVAVLVPVRISHCDCAGVNCTQKKAWRPLDGDLESSGFMIKGGPGGGSLDGQIPRCYEEGAQAVCLELFTQKCVNTWTWNLEWGGETTRLQLD